MKRKVAMGAVAVGAGISAFLLKDSAAPTAATIPANLNAVPSVILLSTSPSNLPDAQVGAAYSFQLTAKQGSTPYTWSNREALPPGLFLVPAADGTLSLIVGVPTKAGKYVFMMTVSEPPNTPWGDGSPRTYQQRSSQAFRMTVQ